MVTVYDLRSNQEASLIYSVQDLFEETLNLKSLKTEISACLGCWHCWVKTPGQCAIKDEMQGFYGDYVKSDKVVLLMDTAQGFVDHKAKAFIDRTIPHYHPYIEIVDGECHHKGRYDRYPDIYYHFPDKDLTPAEAVCIDDYMYRTAYHFQSDCYKLNLDQRPEARKLEQRKPKLNVDALQKTEPMNQLIIYNGSPRRKGSNTATILSYVQERLGERVEIRDLKETNSWAKWIQGFQDERHVLFVLPLYVHAMPSHVMKFIENLKPSKGSIAFVVQSGFPESSQSHYLSAYFQQLSQRLDRVYLGTAIKGGVEGLQLRPEKAQEKMVAPFVDLVDQMVSKGQMDQLTIEKMGKPVYLSRPMITIFKVLEKTNITNFYWNGQLKANKAFDDRHATPFI